VSLLAIAVYQFTFSCLTHRHREQAHSYKGFVFFPEMLMSSTKDPCISLCKFTDDICLGCGRSKREIRAWKKLDNDDKRTVLAEAALRLIKLGRAGRRKKK
jgi:predicted Fe-S protein YdhL (DUF1289 family)